MSERGSFVTEYIYCKKCFDVCKEVLCGNDKYFLSRQIGKLPIIAGKIGGNYVNEEIDVMEDEYIPEIQEKMCSDCKIRISVLSEGGYCIFVFDKNNIERII